MDDNDTAGDAAARMVAEAAYFASVDAGFDHDTAADHGNQAAEQYVSEVGQ